MQVVPVPRFPVGKRTITMSWPASTGGSQRSMEGVFADQEGTRNSVSRRSINLVPSLVYR